MLQIKKEKKKLILVTTQAEGDSNFANAFKERNQVHKPQPNSVRVDTKGNERCRLWLKDGNTTMLLTKELTNAGCKALINSINTTLISLGAKSLKQERFLITK